MRPRSARAKFAWTRGRPFDVFIDVTRGLAAFVVVAFALVLPARARADVGVYPATKVVPVGGVIHGWGDGSGMAVYLVPASAGPQRYPCHGNGICEPTVEHAPGKPFVLFGPVATDEERVRAPVVQLPRAVRPLAGRLPHLPVLPALRRKPDPERGSPRGRDDSPDRASDEPEDPGGPGRNAEAVPRL